MDQPDWYSQANCRGSDPELFYPASQDDAGPALEVCSVCLVRTFCLEFALGARERDGIWGGLTESERRRILRARRKSA